MTAPPFPARPVMRPLFCRLEDLRVLLGMLCLGLFAALSVPLPAHAETPEQSYVQSITDRAIKILSDKTLDKKERFDAFHTLILDNIALDRIAKFALGPYAAKMRASGRFDEYEKVFGNYIARVYAARLTSYSGEHVRLGRSIERGKDIVVFSTIEPGAAGGDPIAVNWRLTKASDNFQIVDVQVVGAWMSLEQQAQFTSIISQNNGDTGKLIDYLDQQVNAPLPD